MLRALIGAAVGAVIGGVQCAIVVAAMRRTARTQGLAGIGVAAQGALIALLVTAVLLLIGAWLLGLRLWALSAIGLLGIELVALLGTWRHAEQLGLHGDGRAALFVIIMIVEMAATAVWWPVPARDARREGRRSASAG